MTFDLSEMGSRLENDWIRIRVRGSKTVRREKGYVMYVCVRQTEP